MRQKLKDSRSDGFTIIEVLIVLAIAGLIMLIVFLAVPALQRNSRNTQRRNDVSSMLSAFNEYVTNNNGNIPTVSDCGADGGCIRSNFKAGFYKETTALSYTSTVPGADAEGPGSEKVVVISGAKCDGLKPTNAGATKRNVVAWFSVETSGSTQQQCQESGA